jgi:imidazolonepropionase-like amidohydrolase
MMKPRLSKHLLAICLSIALTATAMGAPQAQVYAVEHVSVLTMNSRATLNDQTVIIAKGKIVQMGPSSQLHTPKGSRKISGKNKYLLPGLADMHVHLQSPIDLSLFLSSGVTTVFDLNGKPAYLQWRHQVKRGELLGPQLFLCGPYFRDPEPVADAVARVNRIADAGYDAIKIKNNVALDEFDAIIKQARKRGLLTIGHYPRKVGWQHVLESGLTLAHEEEVLYGAFSPDGVYGNVEHGPEKLNRVVQEIASSTKFLIPNLVMYKAIYEQASDFDRFSKHPEFSYLSPWQRARFVSQNPYKSRSPEAQEEFRTNLLFMQSALTPALHEAGVKLLAGTDAEGLGTIAGASLIEELETLHESGLSNYEALQTATSYPALFVGREQEFGKIAQGMRADMILLNSNPLEDLGNLRDLAGVFAGGKWLPREALNRLRRDVPNRFHRQLSVGRQLLESNSADALLKYLEFNDPYEQMGSFLLENLFDQQGFTNLRSLVKNLRKRYPTTALTSEAAINSFGYRLLGREQPDAALQILRWNSEEFPQSANGYDSLADAYTAKNDLRSAAVAYKKALEIDPSYPNAEHARRFLKRYANAQ